MKIRTGRIVRVVQQGEHGLKLGTVGRVFVKHIFDDETVYAIGNRQFRANVSERCLEVVS